MYRKGCLLLEMERSKDTGYRMKETENRVGSLFTKHLSDCMRYVLTLFLLVFALQLHSQNNGYRLETFGTRNGLLSPKIYSLAQTTDRQLWIGSELGVSVFDGYTFQNHQYSSGNETIGRILSITQDSTGGVWVGGDKGLFFFYNDSISRIEIRNKSPLAIESLLTDATGNLWIGELNALYKIPREQIERVKDNISRPLSAEPYCGLKERAYGLAMDRMHNIYMASHGGIYLFPGAQSDYRLIWKNPNVNNFVRSVSAISPDSVYWNHDDGHPTQLIKGKLTIFFDKNSIGRFVFTHLNNSYAITTRDIARMEDGMKPIVSFSGLTNHARAALIDAEGNMWIGTWEGLQKFRRNPFRVYRFPQEEHGEVFSFLEKKNNEILFGGNRGIVFKKETNLIIRHPSIPNLFGKAEILCLYESEDGSLWSGSGYEGISRFQNNKLVNWNNTGNLKDNNCEYLFPVSEGKVFACTENGVTVIDPGSTDPLLEHYGFERKYGRAPELFGGYAGPGPVYWFYGSQGLYRLRGNMLVEDSVDGMPVKNLYINKIIADKKGNIWIATQGKGLLQCRIKDGRLVLEKQYDSRQGIPSNNALSVLADKNDNIWCGDYMSLSLLTPAGNKVQLVSFNEQDGLLSTYYQSFKLEQQKDGTIWGITTSGIFSFHPDSIDQNSLPPVLLLHKVINSGSSSYNPNVTHQNPVNEFSYENNSLQFQYTAISLSDPTKIRYAYRMKGSDSTWTYTSERAVTLNFLSPGRYTFELKASNNNNVWTSQPIEYSFIINPPFWKTTWFGLLVLGVIISMLFLFFRIRLRTVKATEALKQQMAELEGKALRAQMNPHFIFNCLNAIQKLIVVQDMDAAYNYLSKFSKLLRQVLDNSDKNYISLGQELEMNKLYLELESLRFKNSFEYTIKLDQASDPDNLQIPSLLLQPFIENAIWHGLMPKEGDKKLEIRFTENHQYLICTIEDNGIGREKSASIKAQKLGAQYFNSKGTKLSEQRIHLLNTMQRNAASVNFTDLTDDQLEATGTRVTIQIPLQKSK